MFNLLQRSKNLLVVLSSANDLQADGSILVLLWAIHVVHKLVLVVLGHVVGVLDILGRIDSRNWKDCCWVIEDWSWGVAAPNEGGQRMTSTSCPSLPVFVQARAYAAR